MDKPHPAFSGFDWADAQKRFLDAVSAFGGGHGATQPTPDPWQRAIDFWWQGMQSAVPDRDRALYENLVRQSGAFYAVSEQFSRLLAAMSAAQGAPDWESVLKQQMEAWKAQAAVSEDPALRGLLAVWQLPADTWQRTQSLFSISPGMAVPGHSQEIQDRIRAGARLWDEYQHALQDYRASLSSITVAAINRLHERILALGAAGKGLTSLRQIFDLWIECSEAAWAEAVFTEEYGRRYGRLVNALLAFKCHAQGLAEEGLAAANMPTRQGLDSVRRSQRDLKREMRAAAAQGMANAESLSQIRSELESLRQALSGGASRKPDADGDTG